MSQLQDAAAPAARVAAISSPPASAHPAAEAPDPRARLLTLASELARAHNRRLLAEYLTLRRTLR